MLKNKDFIALKLSDVAFILLINVNANKFWALKKFYNLEAWIQIPTEIFYKSKLICGGIFFVSVCICMCVPVYLGEGWGLGGGVGERCSGL